MRLRCLRSSPCSLAAPAAAQREPEWRTAPEDDVLLRPFAYEPRTIRLEAGRPVRLRFVNNGRATHQLQRAALLPRRAAARARRATSSPAAASGSRPASGAPSRWSPRRAAIGRAAAISSSGCSA